MDIEKHKWNTPDSYAGFNPVGHIVVYSQTRDSSIMERSNYERIFQDLKETIKELEGPEYVEDDEDSALDWVYDFRASHWAVGWVEHIMVRDDAPESVISTAADIIAAIEDYPVYDESHYSELQQIETDEFWSQCNLRDRIYYCNQMEISIFAARRDYAPSGDWCDLPQFVDCLH